jgi:hypothetical protein
MSPSGEKTRTTAGELRIVRIITAKLRGSLKESSRTRNLDPRAMWCLELAKLHTALAQVAATALTSDGREWAEVAGRRLSNMSLSSRMSESGPDTISH